MNRISFCLFMAIKFVYFCFMPFRMMGVGVRTSNDIYDPIGQVGWQHWVSRM
jgi:Fe-S cluster biosynthesis and repair protein YggX